MSQIEAIMEREGLESVARVYFASGREFALAADKAGKYYDIENGKIIPLALREAFRLYRELLCQDGFSWDDHAVKALLNAVDAALPDDKN